MISYFLRVREPQAPVNISIPTPAPDQGGPIACLSGPAWQGRASLKYDNSAKIEEVFFLHT